MKKIFQTTATKDKNGFYNHFGIHPMTAQLYGDQPQDIEDIKYKIAKNQELPPKEEDTQMIVDYWGWYDFTRKCFTLIYAKRFLLNMCFPAGIEGTEKHGQGKAYRIEIIK